jgi:hypothetical protein
VIFDNGKSPTSMVNIIKIMHYPLNRPWDMSVAAIVGFPRILNCLIAVLSIMLFISAPALSAVIKVTPDRDPVKMDESFSLVFSSEERVDDDPDFSPLAEDFEILGQNQGSQVSIVNGKMSNRQEWTLTLSPKRSGSITIPAITFGSDHSQPGKVTVLDAGAAAPMASGGAADDSEIKLEVEAAPKNPYVQAQVIYTVKVLLRVNLVGADLSEPVAQNALIERLSDDHRYSTTRNGRDYTVIERKFAVFPQKSGLLRLDPMRLTAQVESGGRSFFARSTHAMQVKSEAIDLQVRPIPAAFTGKHWLPAADLKLEQSWTQNPPRSKAGEPITRTLSLSAIGVTKGLLPEMGAELQLDPSIKQYPDQPVLSEEKLPSTGISSTRQEKTALIPSQPGKFKMPSVAIPWWNVKADRMEIARIPEVALSVEASGDAASLTPPTSPLPQASAEPPQALASNPSPPSVRAAKNAWFWLALFFGSGWLATGLAWWWKRRTLSASTAVQPKSEQSLTLGMARKALRLACSNNDPVAARIALLRWASGYWSHRRPTTLAEIESLGGGPLAEEIGYLNRVLYGNAGEAWKGDALWAVVEAMDEGKNGIGKEGPSLEPMYR